MQALNYIFAENKCIHDDDFILLTADLNLSLFDLFNFTYGWCLCILYFELFLNNIPICIYTISVLCI